VTYSDPGGSSSNYAPSDNSSYADNGGYNDNSYGSNNNGGYNDNTTADNSGDFASRGYSLAPDMNTQTAPSTQAAPAPQPTPAYSNRNTPNVASSTPSVLIYLKDGSTFVASDYWLKGGVLYYDVNYGGPGNVSMDDVDLQRTVDENARRGVRFQLKPDPDPSNTTPSGSYDQQNSAPAPSMSGASQT
jgi:hypothetical protein